MKRLYKNMMLLILISCINKSSNLINFNDKLYIIDYQNLNTIKIIDIKSNTTINNINLPNEYEIYEFLIISSNEFLISFLKKKGDKILYSGILIYSIKENSINEIYRSNNKNQLYFNISLNDDKNLFYFYDKNYKIYDIINNKFIDLEENINEIFFIKNTNNSLLQLDKTSNILDSKNLLSSIQKIDSIIFNKKNKLYYFICNGKLFFYDINKNIEYEIKINKNIIIKRLIDFNLTGKYLYFEKMNSFEYKNLCILDIDNLKIYESDISLLLNYDILIDK